MNSYLSEYKRSARTLVRLFDFEEFEPQMWFPSWWDCSLKFTSRKVRRLHPNEEHVEKAATFLAGIKFGRLRYPQVLAFLANRNLAEEVDAFQRASLAISDESVVFLSRLFDIKGVARIRHRLVLAIHVPLNVFGYYLSIGGTMLVVLGSR